METSEILKKVRKIEIKARGLSSNVFAGQYHSAFKGRGMAFSEVREYQYGDDVRDIDWNVTARFHRPYIKVFEEERELTVMLMIDVSGSLDFGTQRQMKRDMVTEIAATIAFSAIQNNDKIGVVFFSDRIEKYIPPKKGRKHILYIIRELLDFKPESHRTDVKQALEFLTSVAKRRCTAFVLSDFYDTQDFLQTLQIANRKHDVVALQVYDIRAKELPDVGLMRVVDAETGYEQYIDTSSRQLRQKGLHTDARFAVVMPESNVCFSFLHLDTDEKAHQKVTAARQRMTHICQLITERRQGVEELVKGAIPFTYTYVIGGYYNKHLITDQKFWVDKDACIQCGLCQKLCPVDDIKGTPPEWLHNERCTNCLACYHHCPAHAIHWGNMKRGQYIFRGEK